MMNAAATGSGTRIRSLWRSLVAAALLLPLTAWAQVAFTTQAVNVRAGPDSSFPQVMWLPAGTSVNVIGCIDGWRWCDVIAGFNRGWVFGQFLSIPIQNQPIVISSAGAWLGVPLISFSIGSYWDIHYRNRPWWNQRNYWFNRPPPPSMRPRPPHFGPPPGARPPPRPLPPPNVRPPSGGRPPSISPPGSGGRPPSGGNPGSGGRPPTGGNPGSGGRPPSAGNPGSGGRPPSGGNPGSGGRPPSGGNPGSGGRPPSGDRSGGRP